MSPVIVVGLSIVIGGVVVALIEAVLRAVSAPGALRVVIGGAAGLATIWFSQGMVVEVGDEAPQAAVAAQPVPPEFADQPGLALMLQEHPEDVERVRKALVRLEKNPQDRDSAMTLVNVTFTHMSDYVQRTSDDAILAFTSTLIDGFETIQRENPTACSAANPGAMASHMARLGQGREDVFEKVVRDAIERPQDAPSEAEVMGLFAQVMEQLSTDRSLQAQMLTGSCQSVLALYRAAKSSLSRHDFATLLRGGLGMGLGKVRDVIS
jgi:hypothetical protein